MNFVSSHANRWASVLALRGTLLSYRDNFSICLGSRGFLASGTCNLDKIADHIICNSSGKSSSTPTGNVRKRDLNIDTLTIRSDRSENTC